MRASEVMLRTPFTGGAEALLRDTGGAAETRRRGDAETRKRREMTGRKDGLDAQDRLGHSWLDVGGGAAIFARRSAFGSWMFAL